MGISINGSNDTIGSDVTYFGDGSNLTGITAAKGVTHMGLFQLQSNKTSDGDLTDWGQNSTTRAAADIGSAMTHSSGVFTFPTTGKWLVVLKIYFQLTDDTVGGTIQATDDNGSNWSSVVGLAGGFNNGDTAGGGNNGDTGFYFMDVTDTSNDKVKFRIDSVGSSCLAEGGTTRNWTTCFFMRLGDT